MVGVCVEDRQMYEHIIQLIVHTEGKKMYPLYFRYLSLFSNQWDEFRPNHCTIFAFTKQFHVCRALFPWIITIYLILKKRKN